jgi:hypothetical protein
LLQFDWSRSRKPAGRKALVVARRRVQELFGEMFERK